MVRPPVGVVPPRPTNEDIHRRQRIWDNWKDKASARISQAALGRLQEFRTLYPESFQNIARELRHVWNRIVCGNSTRCMQVKVTYYRDCNLPREGGNRLIQGIRSGLILVREKTPVELDQWPEDGNHPLVRQPILKGICLLYTSPSPRDS